LPQDTPLFEHDARGEGDPYALVGQLSWQPLDAHLDALVAAGEAPDGQCSRCRLKCCTYQIAVPEAEVDRVTAAAARLGVTAFAIFRPPRPGDMAGARVLTQRDDGRCLFFDPAERCRIHDAIGPEAKPSVCQLYPGQPTVTPLGARVPVRPECPWPQRTREPDAVARYARVLESRRDVSPRLLVRVVPEVVRLDAHVSAPFAAVDAWLTEAAASIRAAATAMAGLDQAITLLVTRFSLTPTQDPALPARTLAAALSGVLDHCKALTASDAFVKVACAAPPADPRPTPSELVAVALESFEPLRFPTLLAGLGVLRLFVAACDRDARSLTAPNEVLAGYFRQLHSDAVRLPLARATPATLEAAAFAPGL
jgi:hypothetical protein